MFIGSRGIVSYGSHDLYEINLYKDNHKPLSQEEIQTEAKKRIDDILDNIRGTKEEQSIGWNGRGLS